MSKATLTVPAKFADDFRAAITHEIGEEAKLAKEARAKYFEDCGLERMGVGRKADDEDWRSAMKLLDSDTAIFRQASEGVGDLKISVDNDGGTLAFACEVMARDILGPRLVDALQGGPYDAEYAADVRDLIERLTWAVDAAIEVNTGYGFDRDPEGVA